MGITSKCSPGCSFGIRGSGKFVVCSNTQRDRKSNPQNIASCVCMQASLVGIVLPSFACTGEKEHEMDLDGIACVAAFLS